jgi:hypothetical protein
MHRTAAAVDTTTNEMANVLIAERLPKPLCPEVLAALGD